MRVSAAVIIAVLVGLPPAMAAPAGLVVPPAAQIWLDLVDQGRYDESWSVASAAFRARVARGVWAQRVAAARKPLGAVVSRRIEGETHATAPPGMPDGDYEIVRFHTKFSRKADATETVTLRWNGDLWAVAGYFIR